MHFYYCILASYMCSCMYVHVYYVLYDLTDLVFMCIV